LKKIKDKRPIKTLRPEGLTKGWFLFQGKGGGKISQ
jgi:hypothetical protein